MMKTLAHVFFVLILFSKVYANFYEDDGFKPINKLDEVFLKSLNGKELKPANICSDPVFLRRAYLDICGTIPTEQEVVSFFENPNQDKRNKLIDTLIESQEYAEYAAFRWSDILKIKAEFPINLWPNAAQAYYKYIMISLNHNVSYIKIVEELMTSTGSNFKEPAVNFFRAMQGRGGDFCAEAALSAFLGVRYDRLPEKERQELAKFFSKISYKATKEWKEEIVHIDPLDKKPFSAEFFGQKIDIPGEADPRVYFFEELVKHPLFAKNFVNRIFGRLTGNYLTSDPDDLLNAEIYNPALLDFLAKEFVESGYDIKNLYSLILKSNLYRQSSFANCDEDVAAKNQLFYRPRQLEAEVLIDIICKITGTTEIYSSMIPEPYTTMPTNKRAVSIPDGSITTPFLELFAKSPRDTGLEKERESLPSSSQRLHLLNSTHIRNKLEKSPAFDVEFHRLPSPKIADELYLKILSRYPIKSEKAIVLDLTSSKEKRHQNVRDIAWVLINSEEFLNRH